MPRIKQKARSRPREYSRDFVREYGRNEVEDLCEQELQSKFHGLMQDLIRSQNMLNEHARALAALETVETELNRKRALKPRFLAPKC